MVRHILSQLLDNFLEGAPNWYKTTIIVFLLANPFIFWGLGGPVAGWVLLVEFIFTLAMALKCYPLQSGGLLAIEAVCLGLTSPHKVYLEVSANLQVILLLMFMVAGIYFMRDLLMVIFTRILLSVHSKAKLSILFTAVAAFLSAFLDALTVTAVIISVGVGFYSVYSEVVTDNEPDTEHELEAGTVRQTEQDLDHFRTFLASLLMHAVVGTALGGVFTLVGEPQNLLIAEKAGWNFMHFFVQMLPISVPALIAGLLTCLALEKTKRFGYGALMPETVRAVLQQYQASQQASMTQKDKFNLLVQAVVALWLMLALGLHLAEVGIIGLTVIIFLTAGNGVIKEHAIGKSFEEAMPFTALLIVFFAIVSVIHEQHLFEPLINYALTLDGQTQIGTFFLANGLLSMISDNVFVATVYINQVNHALESGQISREQFDMIAAAINAGTNLPSVATPNGQAALLFLLTSAIAPLIRLSYGRMVIMAFPYAIVLTAVGYVCSVYYLLPASAMMRTWGWL